MSNPQNPNPWDNPNPEQPRYNPPPGYEGQGVNQPPQYGQQPPYGAPPPYGQQTPYGGPPPYGAPPPYQSFQSPYGYSQALEGQRAELGPRFLAIIIDGIIVSIPSSIIYGILSAIFLRFIWDTGFVGAYPFSWGGNIVFWGIYAWICYTYLGGNTIGKKIMGIRLANLDGSKPTMATFILHFTIGYFINGLVCALGFIWALFDPMKQTWGQKVFNTTTLTGTW